MSNIKQHNTKAKKSIAGFTLIELMISLSIIIIVIAIAVPNFQRAGEQAQVSGCDANKKILTAQLENYYLNNNKYPLLDDVSGVSNFDENFDITAEVLPGTLLHRGYTERSGSDGIYVIDQAELRDAGYLQEVAVCPKGGFYFIEVNASGKVDEVYCSVMDAVIDEE